MQKEHKNSTLMSTCLYRNYQDQNANDLQILYNYDATEMETLLHSSLLVMWILKMEKQLKRMGTIDIDLIDLPSIWISFLSRRSIIGTGA